mgnify:CR=1 FL=1
MKIKVKRKAKNSWKPEWANAIQNAAIFAGKEFNIDKKKLKVEIILKNSLALDYSGVTLSLNPMKRFVIILNAAYLYSEARVFEIVFHEMTHVKQEFHNGFILDDSSEAHFEGLVYNFESEEDFEKQYWDLPWEVEARKMEKKLWKKYSKKFLTS